MSLELQNEMDQEIHHDNMGIHASNRLAEGQLKARKQTQQMTDELQTGRDSYASAKGLYTGYQVMSNVSQAGGVGKFAAQELGRTKAFAQAKGGALASTAQAAYTKASDTVSAARGFKPSPLSSTEGIQSAVSDDLPEARVLGGRTEMLGGSVVSRPMLNDSYAAKPLQAASDAKPFVKAAASTAEASDTLLDSVTHAMNRVGGVSSKALGAAGGALDVVEDIAHGGLYGNNLDKIGNAMTVASTVLDFVPGMEWLGALGGIAATGVSVAGDAKDKKTQASDDQSEQEHADAPTEQVSTLAERGGVSQSSQDSSHQIQGSSTF